MRWFVPPPVRTAYFASSAQPGNGLPRVAHDEPRAGDRVDVRRASASRCRRGAAARLSASALARRAACAPRRSTRRDDVARRAPRAPSAASSRHSTRPSAVEHALGSSGRPQTTSACLASSRPRARAVAGTVASVVRSPRADVLRERERDQRARRAGASKTASPWLSAPAPARTRRRRPRTTPSARSARGVQRRAPRRAPRPARRPATRREPRQRRGVGRQRRRARRRGPTDTPASDFALLMAARHATATSKHRRVVAAARPPRSRRRRATARGGCSACPVSAGEDPRPDLLGDVRQRPARTAAAARRARGAAPRPPSRRRVVAARARLHQLEVGVGEVAPEERLGLLRARARSRSRRSAAVTRVDQRAQPRDEGAVELGVDRRACGPPARARTCRR